MNDNKIYYERGTDDLRLKNVRAHKSNLIIAM